MRDKLRAAVAAWHKQQVGNDSCAANNEGLGCCLDHNPGPREWICGGGRVEELLDVIEAVYKGVGNAEVQIAEQDPDAGVHP